MKIPLNKTIEYRPEIDGLRTIAVLPVIFFHAGFETFSGGYTGVDIFFVISGYLISSILIRDIQRGKFSLINFYARRFRRILPALFFMSFFWLSVCVLFGLPSDIKVYGESLVATSSFLSNLYFYLKVDYFTPSAENMLLLHTWSLAVEEQFYIFFPIMLWGILSQKIFPARSIITGLILISFVFAEMTTRTNLSLSFYSIHTRAWELLTGSLLAHLHYYGKGDRSYIDNKLSIIWSWIGFILILAPIFLYRKDTPFPGASALPSVFGTALLIHYGSENSFIKRILTYKPVVGVGLISYSTYLWHQPVIAFIKTNVSVEPSSSFMMILAIVSIALGYLSWRFIEVPFRNAKFISNLQVITISLILLIISILIGLLLTFNPNFTSRNTAYAAQLNARVNQPSYGLTGKKFCPNGNRAPPFCFNREGPEFLLWGDSFAMHLAEIFTEAKVAFSQATVSSCFPTSRIVPFDKSDKHDLKWAENCLEFNKQVIQQAISSPSLKTVVISSTYTWPLKHSYYDGHSVHSAKSAVFINAMAHDIKLLRESGLSVVLVGPTPRSKSGFNFVNCSRRLLASRPADHIFSQTELEACDFERARHSTDKFLSQVELEADVSIIKLERFICKNDKICSPFIDQSLIYYDWGHLSSHGAAVLERKFNLLGVIKFLAR